MYTHLQKRGNVYQIRRRIPVDLQAHYGRIEVLRSLRTRDPNEARLRLRLVSVQLDEEFAATRAKLIAGTDSACIHAVPQESQSIKSQNSRLRKAATWGLASESDQDDSGQVKTKNARTFTSLETLSGKWASERRPSKRTIGQMKKVINRFVQHLDQVNVEAITRRQVVEFKEKLLESGQTATNTDKQLVLLNTLLNFAMLNSIIEHNPAKGINVGERKNAKAARLPFDLAALKALFSSPIYRLRARPAGGAGEAAYWLPILALYTGARIEELCQLRPEDVYQDAYFDELGTEHQVWVLRITDEGEGQALKTEGSRRRFPVHAELVRLGFIDFAQRAKGRQRIFNELKPDVMGDESGNWSKWFGKYLRKVVGVSDKRIVFHSFRHKFKDVARECEIPEDVSDAITGHSNGNVARRYGGLTYPLRPLVEHMNRYRIAGISIPHPTPDQRLST